ncbi:MAG: translation elongation factor Ts [Bacteroidetes bacterium RIFCSPLOWO2_12_FULL_31_6]|nr:MAG: translation elongation factor Ts [Bacteroidetes bacterium RIFCSPLOWO2_12_FULL_31_6]
MVPPVKISASDVNKLRQITGSGMMDCKNALVEADGDFEKAIEILRKRGLKVANKRADMEASEGVVLAKTSNDGKLGVILVFNCETDFVAKNTEFVSYVNSLADLALKNKSESIEIFKTVSYNEKLTVNDTIIDKVGVIGEKMDISKLEYVDAAKVFAYIHPGNRLASLVGLNDASFSTVDETGKDIAMQIAAMGAIAVDKDDVPAETVAKELEIAKELALKEGKPEKMLDQIAKGRLNKFFTESTLLNQEFFKDTKKTVRQFLQETQKGLTVTAFKRFALKS